MPIKGDLGMSTGGLEQYLVIGAVVYVQDSQKSFRTLQAAEGGGFKRLGTLVQHATGEYIREIPLRNRRDRKAQGKLG